jgi:dienelactone hydrolase
VVVIHEWWGLTDYPKQRGKMLAENGYVAFVADMFGDGKTTEHPEQAGEWAGALGANQAMTTARFMAAYDQLKKNPRVDADHIAAIGYCMGGSVVIGAALNGVDLDGVASFHGGLPSEAGTGPIQASLLICTGAADGFIPPEQVQAFQAMLATTDADWELISYGGARHGFTNPGADTHGIPALAYNAAADRRSWAALMDFLADVTQ